MPDVIEYGLTPAQYHNRLSVLWVALGKNGVKGDDVFEQVYARIAALEKELAKRKDYDDEREKVLAAAQEDIAPCYASIKRLMDENERLDKELAIAKDELQLEESMHKWTTVLKDKDNKRLRVVVEDARELSFMLVEHEPDELHPNIEKIWSKLTEDIVDLDRGGGEKHERLE